MIVNNHNYGYVGDKINAKQNPGTYKKAALATSGPYGALLLLFTIFVAVGAGTGNGTLIGLSLAVGGAIVGGAYLINRAWLSKKSKFSVANKESSLQALGMLAAPFIPLYEAYGPHQRPADEQWIFHEGEEKKN